MNEYERFLVSFLHNKWLGPNSLFPRTRISQWPKHLPGHLKYGLKKLSVNIPSSFSKVYAFSHYALVLCFILFGKADF
jgi:hypothetical protein